MPDETNNPLTVAQSVERNGINMTLKCFVGKRNEWKDKPYQAAQIETDGTDSPASEDKVFLGDLDWFGKGNVKNFINTIARRFGQDYVVDATGEDGTPDAGIFNLDKFLTYWKNLKSSAMKLSELTEAFQIASTEYKDFTSGELINAFESGDTTRISAAKAKMTALKSTLNSLQADFEERKAKRSKEAQAETITAE